MQPIQGERRRRAGQKHRLCTAADTAGVRRSSICDDMHSKSGVDNNSASMDIAVYDMEKGA